MKTVRFLAQLAGMLILSIILGITITFVVSQIFDLPFDPIRWQ